MLELPGRRLLLVAAVAALILLAVAVAASLPVEKMRGAYRLSAAVSLLVFATVAVSADGIAIAREKGHLANPFSGLRPSDQNRYSTFANLWASRYPTLRLMRNQRLFGSARNAGDSVSLAVSPAPSATAFALDVAGLDVGDPAPDAPNIVLVLFESWGIDLDPSLRNTLLAPYSQPGLLAGYRVVQGTVPFYGSTVAGEARELCGNHIGSQIMWASAQALQRCLPTRLAARGYRDISLHGMDGHMFRRDTWYSSIGFQEQWFRDQFRRKGLPDCPGAFTGTCDSAIAQWMGDRLEHKDAAPDFLYWVTLNSHLPVPTPSPLKDGASCSLTQLLASQPALCSWYQLVANGHDAIARLAQRNLARPTIFIIVGDHAPPFSNPELRSQFSGTDVPFVVLVPRSARQPANLRIALKLPEIPPARTPRQGESR